MSEPTIEQTIDQQITAVEFAADHAEWLGMSLVHRKYLRAAARRLRAMQGKEQSSAATPSHGEPVLRAGRDDPQGSHHADGSAADPPPPEDALVGDIAEWITYLDAHIKEWADANDIGLRETLQRARDRIAADAVILGRAPRDEELSRERLLYLIRQDFDCLPECDSYGHAEKCPYVGGPHQLDELTRQRDAAEARAQAYWPYVEAAAKHRQLTATDEVDAMEMVRDRKRAALARPVPLLGARARRFACIYRRTK